MKVIKSTIKEFCLYTLFILLGSCSSCDCNLFGVTSVKNFKISPTLDHIVYTESETDFFITLSRRLISISPDGSNQQTLWETEDNEGDSVLSITNFQISPDGEYVVVQGDLETANMEQLFSIPIDGGELTLLSSNTNSSLTVIDYAISPDNTHVVFLGDVEENGLIRLYSVPIEGGESTLLSNNTGTDTLLEVTGFVISRDSTRVVFKGDTEIDQVQRLYSVAIDGGEVTTLSNNNGNNTDLGVDEYTISDDNQFVVFSGDTELDGFIRLYSVGLEGGEVVTLTTNGESEDEGRVENFNISPDSSTVVFKGDIESNGVIRLYSIPIEGGTATLLSNNTSGDTDLAVSSFKISSDSQRVLFFGDTLLEGVNRLFSVPIEGGEVIPLLEGIEDESTLEVISYQITSDSRYVVFDGDVEVESVDRLYRVPLGGGDLVILSPNTGDDPKKDLTEFQLSDDGRYVLFFGDVVEDGIFGMFSSSIEDATFFTLIDDFSGGESFEIAADSETVIFQMDINLHSISIEGEVLANLSDL